MSDVTSLFADVFETSQSLLVRLQCNFYSHTFSLIGSCFIHDGFVHVICQNTREGERERENLHLQLLLNI